MVFDTFKNHVVGFFPLISNKIKQSDLFVGNVWGWSYFVAVYLGKHIECLQKINVSYWVWWRMSDFSILLCIKKWLLFYLVGCVWLKIKNVPNRTWDLPVKYLLLSFLSFINLHLPSSPCVLWRLFWERGGGVVDDILMRGTATLSRIHNW